MTGKQGPQLAKDGKRKVSLTLGEQMANQATDQQWLLDFFARLFRGQIAKIEWEMSGGEAPAAPAFVLWQFGIKSTVPYCYTVIDKNRDPEQWVKVRTGKVYVRPTQAIWADYVARAGGTGWSVTTPPLLEEHLKIAPGSLGESWGRAVKPPGLQGSFEVWFASMLGYRQQKGGKKGREKMSILSGLPRLNAAKAKARSASKKMQRKSSRFVKKYLRKTARRKHRSQRKQSRKQRRIARKVRRR